MIRRQLALDLPPGYSAFLWGPRKVETHWIHEHHSGGRTTILDLLETDTFA